jgi:transposase
MAKRVPLTFLDEDRKTLSQERYEHPDPRVQKRMEVLWLISQGLTHAKAAQLAGVSRPTAERYVTIFRLKGVAGLRQFDWCKPKSELEDHRATMEESFTANPPRSVAEACARIKELTGLDRKPTQVRAFMKKLGLKWRCVAAIPLPPKKTVEEHIQTQAEYKETTLEPALEEARRGQAHLFFVDAAHFVMGSYLCCVWCLVRLFIRAGSGRKRYSVLGAWNAVTNSLVHVTTDTVVNAETMCALLTKIAALGLTGPIRIVLDNARYQHCVKVMDFAKQLNIELLFLPSYSPNLNLIERLWKFIKNTVLYAHHYNTFADFQTAIDGCIAKIETEHAEELQTLMTHNFQTFENVSFLAA